MTLPPAAEDDAEGGDGDPRRQRLAGNLAHAGDPGRCLPRAAARRFRRDTYFVKVVGLTLEGYQNSSRLPPASPPLNDHYGRRRQKLYAVGRLVEHELRTRASAVTLGQTLSCQRRGRSRGAVAYAWFVSSASGAETLQAITTINSFAITAARSACGNQPQTRGHRRQLGELRLRL